MHVFLEAGYAQLLDYTITGESTKDFFSIELEKALYFLSCVCNVAS